MSSGGIIESTIGHRAAHLPAASSSGSTSFSHSRRPSAARTGKPSRWIRCSTPASRTFSAGHALERPRWSRCLQAGATTKSSSSWQDDRTRHADSVRSCSAPDIQPPYAGLPRLHDAHGPCAGFNVVDQLDGIDMADRDIQEAISTRDMLGKIVTARTERLSSARRVHIIRLMVDMSSPDAQGCDLRPGLRHGGFPRCRV